MRPRHPPPCRPAGGHVLRTAAEDLPRLAHQPAPAGEAHIGVMQATDGPVRHRVEVTDLGSWFTAHLGFDPRRPVNRTGWLATPTQLLAEATAGAMFHDGLGQLAAARANLAPPPRPVAVRAGLPVGRVCEEEAFPGRCTPPPGLTGPTRLPSTCAVSSSMCDLRISGPAGP